MTTPHPEPLTDDELRAILKQKQAALRKVRIATVAVLLIGGLFVAGEFGFLNLLVHNPGLQHWMNRYACLNFWGNGIGAAVCP